MTLLRVAGLTKYFHPRGPLRREERKAAVEGVSFDVGSAETVAIVGESGAGKSTVARLVLRLTDPDSGEIEFCGGDLLALRKHELRNCRRKLQLIGQDPHSSFDPRFTIGQSVAEPLLVHEGLRQRDRWERAAEVLSRVELGTRFLNLLPHQLSGGQLQRAAIARAIVLKPLLVVCDEPVAALDVAVRAQVLNLLRDLQRELGVSYLFISHDLLLVQSFSARTVVMLRGRVCEAGETQDILQTPQHEYTRALIEAIPRLPCRPDPRPGWLRNNNHSYEETT